MNKVLGVIPARYNSSRFPGKPMAVIHNRPMVVRVAEQALKAKTLTEVVVATDDQRIYQECIRFNIQAKMTDPNCRTGSDRVYEVSQSMDAQIYINIQGDEPVISPLSIDKVAQALMDHPEFGVSTLCYPIDTYETLHNPNVVKVVRAKDKSALYFSRSPIPFNSKKETSTPIYFKHIGIYGYRKEILHQFYEWEQDPIEQAEQLEQLRFLSNGIKIYVDTAEVDSFGVDTKEDLIRVENWIKNQSL